ncbi:MAG: M28 family peptidase [Planctomycetota bacterium]|nr:M28 family peptidase [Planctomycetota bacterium]
MRTKMLAFGGALAALLFLPSWPSWPSWEDEKEKGEITHSELREHVAFLASDELQGRAPGSEGWKKAGSYVASKFRELGLFPLGDDGTYFQEVGILGRRGRNILGLLPGKSSARGDEVVILSSHYDHLGVRNGQVMNGADDDASGVAVMLEVAEAFVRSGLRHDRGILFACFDLEETGLLGALAYVRDPAIPLEKTVANVNLEVLGNDILDGLPDSLFAIGAEYDPTGILRDHVETLSGDSGLDIRYLSHGLVGRRGDHFMFATKGVPFLFLAAGTGPTYHRPTDDTETLNYPKLEKTGRFVRDLVGAIVNGAEKPKFKKPGQAMGIDDARALSAILEVLLEESEGLSLRVGELEFLKGSAVKLRAMTREKDPAPLHRATIAISFGRALNIMTRPRPARRRDF